MLPSAKPATGEQPTPKSLNESFNAVSLQVLDIERRIASTAPIAPRDLSEMRARLSSYYSWLSEQKATMEVNRNRFFRAHRADHASDKATETEWLSTEEGELYVHLSARLKGIEKLISSLRTLIETAQHEFNH